jgi:hypothetical protein
MIQPDSVTEDFDFQASILEGSYKISKSAAMPDHSRHHVKGGGWGDASEGAPCPVFGHTACHRFGWLCTHPPRLHAPISQRCVVGFTPIGSAVLTVLAPQAPSCVPLLILPVAAVACAQLHPVWMESSMLVERDRICGVFGTEDVTAVAAVMLPYEQIKGRATLRGIARRRGFIGL